ncbi:Coiled-coil domain-containing protein isoform 1 [Schistosoma japonicum]|uniref:Coiled-coil domain-containing protein isoform 1 n=1 Tax=Schistosoma japonicum TaxID=6182 RepID=A0A4Z2D268_SCHJA|nr:R3H and coiled-coil domain-containing protein 1 [Schistosoma japonicum]KAH8861170.1 R3H and coiled-coil domain-containing protein 1 [Schistosoma japonicum]KAH8861172.1 R3H and coiled-coil domain-containing protein 1 [Schistosoma japonicum]KAH8861174.1 R3H and coiled-coil domain-containing protein 1 [Schistosoma japonicum]KAH8861176.1 R3H and coiled-coil domain-containing protein 1 [Schistosoma japonicum]
MSPKKPPQALYVPPALRANESASDVNKSLCPLESKIYDSVDKQEDLEKRLKSITLCDNSVDNNNPCVLKTKPTNQKCSHNNKDGEPILKLKDFQHILELYNFPKDFQNFHLEAELTGFEDSGFYLKWVDDSHCLAVFSSNDEANRALTQISGLFMKARRIEDASLASKLKIALSPGDWTMPYKKRPVTTSSTARRLISNHLGIVSTKTKSDEETVKEKRDKALLQEARGKQCTSFSTVYCIQLVSPVVSNIVFSK